MQAPEPDGGSEYRRPAISAGDAVANRIRRLVRCDAVTVGDGLGTVLDWAHVATVPIQASGTVASVVHACRRDAADPFHSDELAAMLEIARAAELDLEAGRSLRLVGAEPVSAVTTIVRPALPGRPTATAATTAALLAVARAAVSAADETVVALEAAGLAMRQLPTLGSVAVHVRAGDGFSDLVAEVGLAPEDRRIVERMEIALEADGGDPESLKYLQWWNTEPVVWWSGDGSDGWPIHLYPCIDVPLLAGDERIGSITAVFDPAIPPTPDDTALLVGIADALALGIRTRRLVEGLEASLLATVEALAGTLEARDQYTSDHAEDIAELSTAVARELGATGGALRDIEWAARFHDIGKIGIPNEILNKPGPLSPDEWEQVKEHPALGARILAPVAQLEGAAGIVHACHEHYDGSGYPDRLSGDAIPLGARVVLVCDAYHAMTSDRPYRRGMTHQLAIQELKRQSGSQFDPQVVAAFMRTHGRSEQTAP